MENTLIRHVNNSNPSLVPQGPTAYFTVSQVAELFHCDPETVKRQARSRKLPGFKFGKSWFFRPRDIDAMIDHAIGAADREDQ